MTDSTPKPPSTLGESDEIAGEAARRAFMEACEEHAYEEHDPRPAWVHAARAAVLAYAQQEGWTPGYVADPLIVTATIAHLRARVAELEQQRPANDEPGTPIKVGYEHYVVPCGAVKHQATAADGLHVCGLPQCHDGAHRSPVGMAWWDGPEESVQDVSAAVGNLARLLANARTRVAELELRFGKLEQRLRPTGPPPF